MHRKLTQAELVAEATELFGPDSKQWAFRCPHCGDVACAQDFIDAGVDPNAVGQECIGRSLGALKAPAGKQGKNRNGRGCDWAAYGLFRGPWEVTVPPDGASVWSFPLAGAEAAQ